MIWSLDFPAYPEYTLWEKVLKDGTCLSWRYLLGLVTINPVSVWCGSGVVPVQNEFHICISSLVLAGVVQSRFVVKERRFHNTLTVCVANIPPQIPHEN